MENKTHKTTAFDAFFAEGGNTPGNAVRLAIADHRAGAMTDWAFVDALREAERRLDAHADLLAALRDITDLAERYGVGEHCDGNILAARAAIAKAEGGSQ